MKILKSTGLYAAPPTPFQPDGAIDLSALKPLAAHLQSNGIAGVFVNGTTGECMSLTVDERKSLASEWRRVLPDGMKLFIHAGMNSAESSTELARHAEQIGADAVAVIAPGYYKPDGIEALTEWCRPIAAAVAEMPFYFYHMPAMNGVRICVADFLEYAGAKIPNLAGVKFTDDTMADFMEAAHIQDARFDILWGRDEMLLGALAVGAQAGIGSTYNIAARLYLNIIEDYREGHLEKARQRQLKAINMIRIMAGSNCFFSALKAILQSQGVPVSPLTRNPLTSLTKERASKICRDIAELGIP